MPAIASKPMPRAWWFLEHSNAAVKPEARTSEQQKQFSKSTIGAPPRKPKIRPLIKAGLKMSGLLFAIGFLREKDRECEF